MLDRKKHKQEIESLKADNRMKDMELSKDYVTEWRTYIAEPLQRDTLREVLVRAKRQSRATTITIDRNDKGDTLKVVQITDLTRARSRVGVVAQRVKTEVLVRDKRQSRVRVDTVYVEKRDSVMVQNTGLANPTDTTKGSGLSELFLCHDSGKPKRAWSLRSLLHRFRATLKWIFFIIIGLIGLIVTVKVCLLRR